MNATVKLMFLEVVWSALSERLWSSTAELKAASGADESTLKRIIDFLVRWDFAETRRLPDLHVRRRPGAISPADVATLLHATNETPLVIPTKRGFRIAERVACRACGWRSLTLVGGNEVECTKCSERQWYTIEAERRISTRDAERCNPAT